MPTASQIKRRLKRDVKVTTTTYETETEDIKGDKTPLKLKFQIWDNPHPVLQPTEEDIGRRVWIVGTPSTFEAELTAYHSPGEHEKFPDGGVEVKVRDNRGDRGYSSVRDLFFAEIILHPLQLTKPELEEHFEVRDLRRSNG